ncbi:hypothetical protein DNI29_17610 [Hymenobacter sediminis]|uniref:hypothetical protein n=1 Tax=Hymenobacter sediminis TaxID=2218621 RepID=UPI000DA641A9|nr:hypothetical protein [Hymenobacter sediminis]RPD45209.1 hypothetical protein DNI29_17610 [Hymenobacter sediminis]
MKTTSTLLATTAILLSGCATVCGTEPEPEPRPCLSATLAVKSLETEYGCQNTTRQMNVNLSETYTVIRSQQEFEQQVSGSCRPQIDFAVYDLVVGKKGLASGPGGINYTLRQECNTNKLVLSVVIGRSMTTEAPNITYHALIPKLAAGQEVGVQVEVK